MRSQNDGLKENSKKADFDFEKEKTADILFVTTQLCAIVMITFHY